MVEKVSVARPYARAIFEIAEKSRHFDKWSTMLRCLVMMTELKELTPYLSDYTIPPETFADLFITGCKKVLDEEGQNFIKILAEKRRLKILPEIQMLYEEFRENAENKVTVECITAIPLNEKQKKAFVEVLSQQLKRKVVLHCEVDPSIMGGFIIRAGDIVINGSIMGRLIQLKEMMGGSHVIKSF